MGALSSPKARLLRNGLLIGLFALALLASSLLLAACQADQPNEEDEAASNMLDQGEVSDVMAEEEEPAPEVEATAVDFSSLKAAFKDKISNYASESSVAVTFYALGDISGGFDLNGNKPMVAASMIKMAVLSDLFEKVQSGSVSLDDVLTVQSIDVVGGAGTGIETGQTFTVRELANRMISHSDNTASNTLVSLLGIDDVNEHAKRMGYEQILLDHKFMSKNYKQDNLVSSNDLADIFKSIADGELGSPAMSSMAEDFLLEQTDELGLLQGLPSGFKLGHKTGSLNAVRNDGGIFYDATGSPSFILVVLTNDVNANTANSLMSALASLACSEMSDLRL